MEVVASLSQGRTAAAQCGLFTHKSVPVIFEPPCMLGVPLFYAHHCLFCNALLCCSALCYCTLFRVVLCSPCVKNTMNSTAPQNMQVAFKFCSSVGDLTLFLPSVILFFRPSAPFSFSCRNYYTSFIALW